MYVVKRSGVQEKVHFDKITSRLSRLCWGLDSDYVDPTEISQKVCMGVYKGVTTSELDELAADTAAHYSTLHPDFGLLAARIAVSNLHKSTLKSFSETCALLFHYVEPRTQLPAPLLSDVVYGFIKENAVALDSAIVYDRDFMYDYFGIKTLQHGYLMKLNGKVTERPQHMLMRVACGIHAQPRGVDGEEASFDLAAAIETYNLMSQKWFTHATPTLFNSGTPKPQLSSCFLLSMIEDSIEGIYDTLKSCAMISKQAGGIGVSVSNIRSQGSYIRGTNGFSNGLIPMLRVFNATARYVDQCFTPDTCVYTDRGAMRIADVTVSDRVFNSEGKLSDIGSIVRHTFDGRVLAVCLESGQRVRVTDEHQIMAVKGVNGMKLSADDLTQRLSRGAVKGEMLDAKELMVGDFVVYPQLNNFKTTRDIPTLSVEDCIFYGVLFRSGHIGEDYCHVDFTHEYSVGEECAKEWVKKYCMDRGIPVQEKNTENQNRLTWLTTTPSFKYHESQFVSAANKHIRVIDGRMMLLPVEKIRGILQGLKMMDEKDKMKYETNNQEVIQSIQFMILRCGYFPSLLTETCIWIPRDDVLEKSNQSPVCDSSIGNGLFYKNSFYIPVSSIAYRTYKGKVYDFELSSESDHTYVTSIGVSHNGGGKRKGAFAVYLEPWHADIFEFLDLKKNHGKEENRARDLFYGLWIPDLFMKRVDSGGDWSLFCPNEVPRLYSTHGAEFEAIYLAFEKTPGKARKVIKARELWTAILSGQTETGNPYMLFKDHANLKSNQKNLGTIRCSNLCTEIIEYTSPDEIAVCNLSSLSLPMFVTKERKFDFQKLYEVTHVVTRNLNKVIDINYYPGKQAETSNKRNRPIGLGVQGLADAFILMRFPFASEEAQQLNKDIFETIYFAALSASVDLAKVLGPYESIKGSPIEKGEFQFDLWGVRSSQLSGRWDWERLKEEILRYGVRNSLLVAPMPTATTSQILGNNEAFEPYTQNVYLRRTLAGEFVCVNRHLLKDLIQLGIWNHDLKTKLIVHNGSVQDIGEIPDDIKALYKTVWEIPQKTIVDMAADRGIFIDQSQSLNIHMQNVNVGKLTSMHFHAWRKGLKTGMYYLRTKPATDAIKFTVDPQLLQQEEQQRRAMEEIHGKIKIKVIPKPLTPTASYLEEKTSPSPVSRSTPSPSPSPTFMGRQTSEVDSEDLEEVSQIQHSYNPSGSLGKLEEEKESAFAFMSDFKQHTISTALSREEKEDVGGLIECSLNNLNNSEGCDMCGS